MGKRGKEILNWNVETAKNGQKTLKLNNIYIYSKYNPNREVKAFMEKVVKGNKKKFILVGLGLGYHMEYLKEHIPYCEIRIIILDKKELEIYELYHDKRKRRNIEFFNIDEKSFNEDAQLIIPQSFLTGIGRTHPLFSFIEDIKIKQTSFEKLEEQLENNFKKNLSLFKPLKKEKIYKTKAALISAGPSLNETISWLKKHEEEMDIYCVGSALKVALKNNLWPIKVFMADAKDNMMTQIPESYNGELIFLSTANNKAVILHKGKKQFVCQQGYSEAEKLAKIYKQPLFKTGGSVATLAFSYINWLGYEELYLFGQDLGFNGNYTHAQNATSGHKVGNKENLIRIKSNKGELIETFPILLVYKRWFEREIKNTSMKVFNTALNGAEIEGASFYDIHSFEE